MAAQNAGFHHPLVRAARLLHLRKHREERRCFLIEGATLVATALDAGAALECAFISNERQEMDAIMQRLEAMEVPALGVDARTMASLSQTRTPPGIVAMARFLHRSADDLSFLLPPHGPALLAVFHHVADPGNAGTLVRSCQAFRAAAACFGPQAVDPYNDKVIRSTMGSVFGLPLIRYGSWSQLRPRLADAGLIIAAGEAGAPDVRAVTMPARIALIIGHERQGMAGLDAHDIQIRVGIPQARSVDSLNAAVAGSILLYEIARSAGLMPARQ